MTRPTKNTLTSTRDSCNMIVRGTGEIFLNISDEPFDQNRLFGALGIQVNDNMNIQVGYLRHRLGTQNLNRLQFAVFLNTGKKED